MNEWIKTADKKPKLGQAVLGVKEDGYVTRFDYIYDVGRPGFSDEDGMFSPEEEIIAWMPLPVYEGEKRMTDTFNDSLETLYNILSITHNPVLPNAEKVDFIQLEVEYFLERHEERKT